VALGTEVRRRRKARGWTLEVLAEKADLTPHYLSTLETGRRDPSVSTVQQLAKAFGCAPGELLGSDILTPRPKHLQIMPLSGLGRSKTCDICAVCAREIVRVS
jgi:transcriptional regulator with XRE-family HTH domain